MVNANAGEDVTAVDFADLLGLAQVLAALEDAGGGRIGRFGHGVFAEVRSERQCVVVNPAGGALCCGDAEAVFNKCLAGQVEFAVGDSVTAVGA